MVSVMDGREFFFSSLLFSFLFLSKMTVSVLSAEMRANDARGVETLSVALRRSAVSFVVFLNFVVLLLLLSY